MKEHSIFVGMDVHKNSIDIAIAEKGRQGPLRHFGTIEGSLAALDKVVRKLVSNGQRPCFVYEAGPCGYQIYRHLTAKGFDCAVVAPSLITGCAQCGPFPCVILKELTTVKSSGDAFTNPKLPVFSS